MASILYHIVTFGCQMNKSDSERIAAVLEGIGYQATPDMNAADLILVNMCSVRQSAVNRVFGLAQKLKSLKTKKQGLKTVLTGCVLKADRRKFAGRYDLILDIENLPKWPEILKEKVVVKSLPWQGYRESCNYLKIQPKYSNNFLAFVPISNGCNWACSYCVIPLVRGKLVCRDRKEILKELENVVKRGHKEVWLLGQNVNDYISPTARNKNSRNANPVRRLPSNGVNFAKLIKTVNDVSGEFKFFFISPHPTNFSDELIETLAKCGKFGKYLNLPVQSGDDEILKKMKRPYTAEQYKNLVKKIRKKIPDISLSTDIIVGFPSETKKQFENTVKLVKEISFDRAYISRYSPRPRTAAAKLKDNVSFHEKKRRWRVLNDILNKKNNPGKNLIVILGPTASGKSELAIKLAKKFNGEIISADSRQIYKEMDIGTGKVTKKEMSGVPHYLLDVASPKRRFTVAQYRKLALKAIDKIFKKGKIPILCGGSGFYIRSVVDGISIPEVLPDWKLRKSLEKKPTEELYKILKKLDFRRAKTIEKKNPRRLIRAIEIATKIGRVPFFEENPLPYPVLILGIQKPKEELGSLIEKRFLKWLKMGLMNEVKKLREMGLSWNKIDDFGIHYRAIGQYLRKKINYQKMIEDSLREIRNYAKRQMSWFKRDKRIRWVKNYKEAERSVRKFLEK